MTVMAPTPRPRGQKPPPNPAPPPRREPMPNFTDRQYRKERILEITCRMVESRVSKGEVNLDDPEDLKRAVKAAAKDAKAAYDAAVEYISG